MKTTHLAGVEYVTYDLRKSDYEGFYDGTNNGFLWPALHGRVDLAAPAFSREDNKKYESVNRLVAKIADIVLKPGDIANFHDSHLFLAASYMKAENPKGFFLHIPAQSADLIENLESREQQKFIMRVSEALFSYDFVGVQSKQDLAKLRSVIGETVPKKLDLFETETFRDTPNSKGVHTQFGAFPVGVDVDKYTSIAKSALLKPETQEFLDNNTIDIISVDRLDPAKGLVAKATGVGRYLIQYGNIDNTHLLQIAPVGRKGTQAYGDEFIRVETGFNNLNEIFGANVATLHAKAVPRPIHLAAARQANEILVTSLADGFNIYILEALAANVGREKPAVGILSKFTGAADILNGHVLRVDPRNPASIAQAIHTAKNMGAGQRQDMLGGVIEATQSNSNEHWQCAVLEATTRASQSRMEAQQHVPPTRLAGLQQSM